MSEAFLTLGKVATFRELLPRSLGLVQPPRFALGTFPAHVASYYYAQLHLTAVGLYACSNVELSDAYVLHHDGQLVAAPDCKLFPKHLEDIPAEREAAFKGRPRRRVTGTVAYVISPGYLIYGHWLAEILPRLAVLEASGESLERLVFPVPSDTPKFGLELLHLCGVPKSQILLYDAEEVLQPDELLVPTLIHNGVRYAPLLAEAVALFKRGVEKAGYSLASSSAPSRIYLFRAGGNRRLVNRDTLQPMAEAAGFTCLQPEKMSLPEQMAMFASAREIAGEYGSAFHTALFSPPGTIVCGLRGDQIHPGFLQTAMGDVLGQPTGYVFGQCGTGRQPHDYTVDEKHFADCLRTVFHPKANISIRATARAVEEKPPQLPPPTRLNHVPRKRRFWELLVKRRAVRAEPVAPGSLFQGLWSDSKGK